MGKDSTNIRRLRAASGINQAERLALLGFWEWDVINDHLTYCSEGYAHILGMSVEACIAAGSNSDNDRSLVHSEDRQRYIAAEEQAYIDGTGIDIEYRLVTADGQTRNVQEISEVTKNDLGEVIQLSGTIQDISQRKSAEGQLRESERKWRAWLEHSPACTKIVDLDFNLQYMSNAGIQGLGIDDITDFYGKPYPLDFYPESFRTEMAGSLKQVVATGEIVEQEAAVLDLEGNEIWFHSTLVPVQGENAQIDYIMIVSLDITERKHLNDELIKMEKLESIGVLAGGIAHDLNNLLTAVVGNLSLARMCESAAEKDATLAEAEKASQHVEALAEQLLTFAKGGLPVRQRVDLGKLLSDWASFPLRGSNVTAEYTIADDLWDVNVDDGQINQVITNVVINAMQSMPRGGAIKLRAENITLDERVIGTLDAGSYVKITVADEGEGIPHDIKRRIFDPFFSTKNSGSGLGLATSHSIIEKHDGYITVDSSMGAGTTFSIYLPIATGEKPLELELPKTVSLSGKGSVLLMDDEKAIREFVVTSLSKLGYRVTTSRNDVEAVAAYEKAMKANSPYDLVILDLTIPGGLGGRDVIQRLLHIDPNVTGIVCSGYSTDPVMAKHLNYGFKASISKPFRVQQLGKVVRAVLEEHP